MVGMAGALAHRGWMDAEVRRAVLGGLAAFCGLCVALFGVLADINAAKRADVKASFESTIADLRTHFPEYVRTFPAADVENEPAALGKMVIVDMDARDFHWTFERALPQDMRPRTNAEVDYVVQVRNARKLVGRYSRGGSAYQWQCDYQLVDFRAGRTVFSGSIQGTPPPQSKRYGGMPQAPSRSRDSWQGGSPSLAQAARADRTLILLRPYDRCS
jgi:hypothetical protein